MTKPLQQMRRGAKNNETYKRIYIYVELWFNLITSTTNTHHLEPPVGRDKNWSPRLVNTWPPVSVYSIQQAAIPEYKNPNFITLVG